MRGGGASWPRRLRASPGTYSALKSWNMKPCGVCANRAHKIGAGWGGAQTIAFTTHRSAHDRSGWVTLNSIGWPTTCRAQRRYTTKSREEEDLSRRASSIADSVEHVESLRYWNDLINKIERPTARMMLSKIDRENLTGVDTSLKGVSTSKNSLYQFLLDVKTQHPTKVILVRVGEFYETWGFDAVLLVEHAGLNPMGFRLPRAGCPKMNIQRTLDDLTAKGLRCVVCEEAPMPYSYGARSKRKTRFIAQVVTPHSPVYVYNLSSNHALSPDFGFQAPPVVGVEQRKQDAFTVMLMDVDLRQVATYHDVNEEIAAHIISSNGFSPPVYCHESYLKSLAKATKASYGQKIHSIIQDSHKVRVKGDPFLQKFVECVKQDLDLGAKIEFAESPSSGGTGEDKRPSPLYSMTAQSIGLSSDGSSSSNTPSLVSALLPVDAPAPCKHFMTRFLMHPPPLSVSKAVQRSLQSISQATEALPLLPILPAHKIAKMIHTREANHSVFVDLLAMIKGIQGIFASRELEEALFPLTAVAAMGTGRKFKTSEIQDVCEMVIAKIEGVINTEDYQELISTILDKAEAEVEEEEGADHDHGDGNGAVGTRPGDQAFESMVYANEKSVRVVLGSCIEAELEILDSSRQKLKVAIQEDLEAALGALPGGQNGWTRAASPRISFDAVNNSVSIRGAAAASQQNKGWAGDHGLIHPKDRNGSRLSDRFSTTQVEETLDEYRYHCHQMDLAVRHALRSLAERIAPYVTQIVYLSHLALVSKSFWLHAGEAARKGWAMPTLAEEGAEGREMRVDSFWPFWMDAASPETVKNSVQMDKLVLLTGPNMAGKSTVIRSICAASLLANCGLFAPCEATSTIPHFDAYILRSAESADSPVAGLSTFAVEMSDARAIVRDATERSLVFVDELCKGTEARAGACIAAAAVEHLSLNTNCLGLFATHLHDMLKLPLNDSNLGFMKMETVVRDEWKRETTWKIVDGVCTESLAYQVAEKYGVPSDIVDRAYQLSLDLDLGGATEKEEEEKEVRGRGPPPPPAPASVEEAPTFEQGVGVLLGLAEEVASGEPARGSLRAVRLERGSCPPPSAVGFSCLYVLTRGGQFYVGETDDISGRFQSHQAAGFEDFAFVKLDGEGKGGKSVARLLETKAIRKMEAMGFDMLSDADGKHQNFATKL